MAKINKSGICLPLAECWPVGVGAECSGCSCQWTVEGGDKVKPGSHVLERSGRERITLQCPECGDWITHTSSRAIGSSAA